MTSTPFTSSSLNKPSDMTEGVSLSRDHTEEEISLTTPSESISQETQIFDTEKVFERVERYATSGKMDIESLTQGEIAVLYHVLRRLHEKFVKQIDCDEIKCDAARKCPKCGVSRVNLGDKMPKSPTLAPRESPAIQPSSPLTSTDIEMN